MSLQKSIIATLFLFSCFTFFSQKPIYSKDFAALKSHVPIQIVDADANSFCVLRYNHKIHDFTVERRSKIDFEIKQFAALSLDSINANWFDYENLNYLF